MFGKTHWHPYELLHQRTQQYIHFSAKPQFWPGWVDLVIKTVVTGGTETNGVSPNPQELTLGQDKGSDRFILGGSLQQ